MKPRFIANPAQFLLVSAVQGYRLFFRAWLGSACRFEPSCSAYAVEALTVHGAAAGSYLTLRRLVRCQPCCEGGHDPVPLLRTSRGLFAHFSYQQTPVSPEEKAEPEPTLIWKNTVDAASRTSLYSEKIPP